MISVAITLLAVVQVIVLWRLFVAKKAIMSLFGIISSILDIMTTQNKIEILKGMEKDVDKYELEFRRIIDSM